MKRETGSGKNKSLDRMDCELIRLLQKDGRIPNTEIAKTLGVSEATVRTRLNRLTRQGYIQIVAVSNPLKIGFGVVGAIRMQADTKKIDHITRELNRIKSLWFIVHGTGGWDIYTEFVAKSLADLNTLLYEKINTIDGVIRTETSLILNYIKRDYDWGTGFDADTDD
ncbi:MAG: Lrp/AsnC family transcriptional regulator [Desulfobacteraceae bacterium]|nr:Lrp/AsnC family transcriptional regulator [Desulfobacteraceae bacterium]